MKPRFPILTILAALAVSVLVLLGCEEKTRYITTPDVPAIPVGVYSVTGDGYVDVYWQSNNDGGVTDGYGVYRYVGTNGDFDEYELLGTVDASSSQVEEYSYRDDDVQNGETYYYAVNAFNGYGESELSDPDAFDTPRPQGAASARDFHQFPNQGGFDFSRARTVFADENADVWFEYDPDLEAFFVWAANDLTDLQPYGYADNIQNIGWGDPGDGSGWSEVGWMELSVSHGYIVWTADNHYACIFIKALDYGSGTVSFDWAYQTDEGNPELKRVPKTSPPHAENYGRRSGN